VAPPAPLPPARPRTPLLARPLNYAWNATFHCNLHPEGLKKWPEDAPHTFNTEESKWLAETLRYFKRSAGPYGRPVRSSSVCRALETAPPPPAKVAPVTQGSRKDEGVQEASRKRGASAPVKAKKLFAYCTRNIYTYYIYYFSYVNNVYCNVLYILRSNNMLIIAIMLVMRIVIYYAYYLDCSYYINYFYFALLA
jgi:hypothetical protein